MPLTITVPGREFYDPAQNRFVMIKPTTLTLEHSLLSISKWEAKWHKPYLSREAKTNEENLDYIRCMCVNRDVDPKVLRSLDRKTVQEIADYIGDPMTATTIKRQNGKGPSREIVTNELIYYWMTTLNIPFDPCEKWHLNRLMILIEVASIKSQPPKKMPKREWASQRAALNAQRKAKYNTRG